MTCQLTPADQPGSRPSGIQARARRGRLRLVGPLTLPLYGRFRNHDRLRTRFPYGCSKQGKSNVGEKRREQVYRSRDCRRSDDIRHCDNRERSDTAIGCDQLQSAGRLANIGLPEHRAPVSQQCSSKPQRIPADRILDQPRDGPKISVGAAVDCSAPQLAASWIIVAAAPGDWSFIFPAWDCPICRTWEARAGGIFQPCVGGALRG